MWLMVLFAREQVSTPVLEYRLEAAASPGQEASPDSHRGSSAAEIAQVSDTHRRGVRPPTIHPPA
jgi:hypothetical protein